MGVASRKAEILIWMVMLGRLNTMDWLLRLNIINVDQSMCPFCNIQRWKLSVIFSSLAIITHGRYGAHVCYGGGYTGVAQINLESSWMLGWESNGLVSKKKLDIPFLCHNLVFMA